jgi:hypothetical protein
MIRPDCARGELTFDFLRSPDRRASVKSLLLDATNDIIVVALEYFPSKPLDYLGKTVLDVGYLGISFLFKDRPFIVCRVYRPDLRRASDQKERPADARPVTFLHVAFPHVGEVRSGGAVSKDRSHGRCHG